MPELPEAEAVARTLDRLVSGKRIRAAELIREKLAPGVDRDTFSKYLEHSNVNYVHRRGKHILFDLNNGRTLLTHLRMTGRFLLLSDTDEDPKFAHAVLNFDDGSRLVFDDQRHFGMMAIIGSASLGMSRALSKLAPEPLSDDFSLEYIYSQLSRSSRPLKEFLLDQTKVCGLGNIYAAEALFLSGINPRKKASSLSKKAAKVLHSSIRAILHGAIERTTGIEQNPRNISGTSYADTKVKCWRVYDREGEACHNCSDVIVRITQAGRSTYFCRTCQK